MALRGIRGAITVEENSREEILQAAQLLVTNIMSANEMEIENVGAIIFSVTKDLTAAFPAAGVRQIDAFRLIPLFDAQEMEVEGSLQKCIRVLVLADLDKKQRDIVHIYLGEAKKLRPDLN